MTRDSGKRNECVCVFTNKFSSDLFWGGRNRDVHGWGMSREIKQEESSKSAAIWSGTRQCRKRSRFPLDLESFPTRRRQRNPLKNSHFPRKQKHPKRLPQYNIPQSISFTANHFSLFTPLLLLTFYRHQQTPAISLCVAFPSTPFPPLQQNKDIIELHPTGHLISQSHIQNF